MSLLALGCAENSEDSDNERSDMDYDGFYCVYDNSFRLQGAVTEYEIFIHETVYEDYLSKEENLEARKDDVTQQEVAEAFEGLEKLSSFLSDIVTIPDDITIFICPGEGSATFANAALDPGRLMPEQYKDAILLHEYAHTLFLHTLSENGVLYEDLLRSHLAELLADFAASSIKNDPSFMAESLRLTYENEYKASHLEGLTEEIQEKIHKQTVSRDFSNRNAPIVIGNDKEDHTTLGPVVSEIGRIWSQCEAEEVDIRKPVMSALITIDLELAQGGPSVIGAARMEDPTLVRWNDEIKKRIHQELAAYPCTWGAKNG